MQTYFINRFNCSTQLNTKTDNEIIIEDENDDIILAKSDKNKVSKNSKVNVIKQNDNDDDEGLKDILIEKLKSVDKTISRTKKVK